MPGAYTCRLNAGGVEVTLPSGITMDEAIRINTEGLKWEGIEEIKDDGTVILTDEGYQLQKKIYGIDLREFKFLDMDDLAREIVQVLGKLINKYQKK